MSTICLFPRCLHKVIRCTHYHHYKCIRRSSSVGFSSYGCAINSFGNPLNSESVNITSNVIDFNENSNQLLLKTHAAPINPSDINIIEGKYALLPKTLPVICGNDGIFEVRQKGKLCSTTSPNIGQFVIPSKALLGTWQQYIICNEADISPINFNIDDSDKCDAHLIAQLSMISVNPCTAYRMINDYVSLNEDEYIIQNGANSAVGECVIQIARNYGIKTINIIRGSAEKNDQRFNVLSDYLHSLGADHVIGDQDLSKMRREDREKLFGGNKPPRLGLNCVGGNMVNEMMKFMTSEQRSYLVTYGGMSKKPISIGTGPLIFRDIVLSGFWLTRWKKMCETDENMQKEFRDMIECVSEMITNHDLEMGYKLIRFGEKGQGMMSGLRYAMNENTKSDDEYMVKITENQSPTEVRGKIVMGFDDYRYYL